MKLGSRDSRPGRPAWPFLVAVSAAVVLLAGACSSPAASAPGGTAAAAALHQARAVCRRAERAMVALASIEGEEVGEPALAYVNRLSDYLFVAARAANDFGRTDVLWAPGANQDEKE